jgi:hypothetical protein
MKAAKASLPSRAANTSTTCFKCGKPGHLRKECKNDSPQSGGYCSGCGAKGHSKAKYWKLHPDLKPIGSKGAKAGGNEKEENTKADLTLEAFAHIRSQTAASKEAPHGASPSLDPQRGEGNKQAWLPESFTLREVVPTSSMVPLIRVRVPSAKIIQGGA